MRPTFYIMNKELQRWVKLLGFYVLLALLLFCVGLYTWFFNDSVAFFDADRIMPACLRASFWGIAVFVPILATGTIVEERKFKTLGGLLAKPVKIYHIVLGKLLAVSIVLLLFLVITLLYYVSVSTLITISLAKFLPVYLFLYIMGIAYAVLSMAVACFFFNYWKSYFWSYLIVFTIHFLASFLGKLSTEEVQFFFYYIGVEYHFNYFLSGGFALSSLVYLASIIFIGLFLIIYKLNRDNS